MKTCFWVGFTLQKKRVASDQDLQSIQSVKQQLVNYLQREGGIKVDIPIRCVLIYPGWKVDFTEAMGKNAPVQVSATTALINRLVKKHSSTSIIEGSTADCIDQLLDAKNVVRLEKF